MTAAMATSAREANYMLMYANNEMDLKVYPLSRARWEDFELLFGKRGACGGCWCMLWRVEKAEFESGKGEPNKRSMKSIVDAGEPAGVLAYVDGKAIGWCAVAHGKHIGVWQNRSRSKKWMISQSGQLLVCS